MMCKLASAIRWMLVSLVIFVLSAFVDFTNAGDIQVEAVVGVPFGVGHVTITAPDALTGADLDTRLFSVSDSQGRVHYPVVRFTEPMGLFRELLGVPLRGARPSELHFHFLFQGSEPLDLHIRTPTATTLLVTPNDRPAEWRRLLQSWWMRYQAVARKQRSEGDYVPIVETYLTHMLAQRLGLDPPLSTSSIGGGDSLDMMLGTERLRLRMLGDTLHSPEIREASEFYPLPTPIAWRDAPAPAIPDNASIEEIAQHVPEECFYIRYANFANYVWMRKLLEEYGGDLSRMVTLRGTDAQLNERTESQLGLRESALSRLFGGQVISDVAMLGRDTFLREGAAIGIIFEAKNELLGGELQKQRQQRVQELLDAGARMEEIAMEGETVSFAYTDDNRLRSFYVQDGRYHLVTNCKQIASRFLQCGKQQRSLAQLAEFRHARSLVPVAAENTLFVFLSREFLQGLLSPEYQIELHRRLQSVTDGHLMELATLAAMAEGYGQEPVTMSRLVQLGFLSSPVNRRTDGSETRLSSGRVVDSLRGARGTYTPIPDMPVTRVTLSERDRYRNAQEFYERNWRQLDPVIVGIRRSALDEQIERVDFQIRMFPMDTEQYGKLIEFFGPPNRTRIRPLDDDIVSVQAFVGAGNRAIPPHHLYFGVRNEAPQRAYSERRLLKSLQVLRTAPAYLAAWPSPAILDRLGLVGRPVGDGFYRLLLGLYRYQSRTGFSLLSFDQEILADVADRLEMEDVEEDAQVRIDIGDVKQSAFGEWANDLDFQRAWETSVGNVHLLHVLSQQFHIPMEKSQRLAERLLDASLHCPMHGEYELVQEADGEAIWVSTAWQDGKEAARARYVSPLMTWLRGLNVAVTFDENRAVASGFLNIQRSGETENGLQLPSFSFGFGGGKADESKPSPNGDRPKLTTDSP